MSEEVKRLEARIRELESALRPLVDAVRFHQAPEDGTSLFLTSDGDEGPEVLDAVGLAKLLEVMPESGDTEVQSTRVDCAPEDLQALGGTSGPREIERMLGAIRDGSQYMEDLAKTLARHMEAQGAQVRELRALTMDAAFDKLQDAIRGQSTRVD